MDKGSQISNLNLNLFFLFLLNFSLLFFFPRKCEIRLQQKKTRSENGARALLKPCIVTELLRKGYNF